MMLCTPKQFLLIGSILSAFVVNDFVTGDDGVLDDDVNNVLKMLMSTEPLPDPMVEFEPDEFLHDSNQLINEMIDFRSEVMSRTGELNDKFDELEKLLRNHPACQADSQQTPDTEQPGEPTPAAPPEAAPTSPVVNDSPTPPADEPAEKSVITQPVAIDREPSIWKEESTFDTIAVLDSVVNPLALANNLYASGETKIALKMYQQLRQDGVGDQEWVTYQIAQCHRVLGSKSNADQAFRIVTAMPKNGRWGEYSRWWLANGDSVSAVSQKTDQLETTLKELRRQLNESTTE